MSALLPNISQIPRNLPPAFRDSWGGTNNEHTNMNMSKSSWALGGGAAASQTVESFMQGAAKTIAAQVAQTKTDATAAKNVGAPQP